MAFSDWEETGSSSHVDAMRFDPDSGTMQVRYQDGSVYEWFGVQEDTALGVISASSPGKYLNANISGLYGKGNKVS